ncbi:MAG: ribonuclease Y [Clostridia bacterium]|nr:ribonuclease Y [Clostridia bacterium]
MEIIIYCVLAAVAVILGIGGFFAGVNYRKKVAEGELGSAEEQAKKILNDAYKQAESKKRELTLEAKEEIQKLRSDYDKEVKEKRNELNRQDRRLQQKEDSLDKKIENAEKKEAALVEKAEAVEKSRKEIESLKEKEMALLERIADMSTSEAKDLLLKKVEGEIRHETAKMISDIESKAKDEADEKAKNIIGLAIQRCAADHVTETTVSVVSLPNDEMKGRIIGREGRNIRAIETLTGIDLIIDDTPEAVILSGFDPVRREVARIALEKLISDGRIHPARIEETVERAQKAVAAKIKAEGERATFETGVHGLHPELVKLLGKMCFRTSYGQNVLQHSIEVAHIAGLMAGELGADVTIAKRAGLLHDIGKSVDHEVEGSHVTIGAELAKKYGETEEIIHPIMAHHGDVECKTLIACLVQAADAISAARPGARRENIENYIKRLEKLEEIANSFEGVETSYAIQAGREIRIMVKPDSVSDDGMVVIARDIAKEIESSMEYPGQIKVNVIRETRSIDYAK